MSDAKLTAEEQEDRAYRHVVATYMESGGDVALTANRLGWKIEEVRAIVDDVSKSLAADLQTPEGRQRWLGRNFLDAGAITSFSMEKMRTSERAGHRWGGLALASLAHQDRLGALALTQAVAGMPTVVVVNAEVPPAMAIQADGKGGFVDTRTALPDRVPVKPESAES